MAGADFVEIVLDQRPLRDAMLEFSRNILILSLFISGITASLVYFALQWVIVRPVRRLTGNIAAFAERSRGCLPRHPRRRDRADEIGVAEQARSRRWRPTLADELRQKRHLAELGLAVSKINHELRNMLTTAQLLTDRLEGVSRSGRAARRAAARRDARAGDRVLRGDARLWPGRRAPAAATPRPACARSSTELARPDRARARAPGSPSQAEVPADLRSTPIRTSSRGCS